MRLSAYFIVPLGSSPIFRCASSSTAYHHDNNGLIPGTMTRQWLKALISTAGRRLETSALPTAKSSKLGAKQTDSSPNAHVLSRGMRRVSPGSNSTSCMRFRRNHQGTDKSDPRACGSDMATGKRTMVTDAASFRRGRSADTRRWRLPSASLS